jgi:hypothetical protein
LLETFQKTPFCSYRRFLRKKEIFVFGDSVLLPNLRLGTGLEACLFPTLLYGWEKKGKEASLAVFPAEDSFAFSVFSTIFLSLFQNLRFWKEASCPSSKIEDFGKKPASIPFSSKKGKGFL